MHNICARHFDIAFSEFLSERRYFCFLLRNRISFRQLALELKNVYVDRASVTAGVSDGSKDVIAFSLSEVQYRNVSGNMCVLSRYPTVDRLME